MLSPFRDGVCRAPLTLPFCLPAPRREKEATRSSRWGWNVEDADGGRRRRESGWGGCTCQRGRRTPSLEPSPVFTLIQFGDSGRAKSKDDEAGEWW